jgi:hypothetical protein
MYVAILIVVAVYLLIALKPRGELATEKRLFNKHFHEHYQ